MFNHRDGRKGKYAKRCGILVLTGVLLFGVSVFSGCGTSAAAGSGTRNSVFTVGGENCSRQEMKVILTQVQKEYSSKYGIDVWESGVVDQEALASYMKNSAVSQLAQVYALDLAGEKMGVSLTEEERALTQEAAKTYMDSLDDETAKYLDAGENDLAQLFERYLLAERTYTNIVETVSTEVSDEEALVMDMQVICVSDADRASELLSRLQSGDDFTALAQTYSEERDIEIPVTRTTYGEAVSDRLFAMNDGEYSEVIEIDGKYYLFYCSQYFDENLTEQNKAAVLEARRESAVREVCDSYADPADSVLRESVLSKIEIDPTLDLSGPTFREVFESYFS